MTNDRARTLSAVLLALAVVQLLHGLDLLRTDPSQTLASILSAPQAISGIGGSVLAAVAVRQGWRAARLLAVLSGGLVALGFIIVHGLPWATPATEPYWGEGSADPLQWLGVLTILALCAWTLRLSGQIGQPAGMAVGATD